MTQPIEKFHPHRGDWLRDIVFGLNDRLVTTLVFVIAISALDRSRLVTVALSELLAGGVSMGLGGYVSARTAQEVLANRIATERLEIAEEPDEERAELRAIYYGKGLRGALLDGVVSDLTADEDRWLRAMVRDELGVVDDTRDRPWLRGILVAISFMVGAFVPIVPFLARAPVPQVWAYGATAITVMLLGMVKARYTHKGPVRSGLELLGVVTAGTVAGVLIGLMLHAV